MKYIRRASAAVAAISLAVAGCVSAPSGPPAGAEPQLLRISTYRGTDSVGPQVGSPLPGDGWGKLATSDLQALPGAQCTATNDRGSWTVVTPGAVEVLRSASPLRVTCGREGYREASVELGCISPRAIPGAAVAFRLALYTPAAVVVLPAAIAVLTVKAAAALGRAAGSIPPEEPEVCVYGTEGDVQVFMELAR